MQRILLREVWRPGVEAIVRMSATRANYWAECALDSLLAVALLGEGMRRLGGSMAGAAAAVLGLLAFSLIEYVFHRWMFHASVPLFEEGHRRHHEQPLGYDALPFFLPAMILLVLAGALAVILPTGLALMLTGGITVGYVVYGLAHFSIHHTRFRHPLLRRWAAAHHVHHYHPETNFGVTTPLWDALLGTRYLRQPGMRPDRHA